jgi:hypothetical protein
MGKVDMPQPNRITEKYVEQLESLVEELLKDSPEEQKVKAKMQNLGIDYTTDPVERINRVLQALHPDESLDFEE